MITRLIYSHMRATPLDALAAHAIARQFARLDKKESRRRLVQHSMRCQSQGPALCARCGGRPRWRPDGMAGDGCMMLMNRQDLNAPHTTSDDAGASNMVHCIS